MFPGHLFRIAFKSLWGFIYGHERNTPLFVAGGGGGGGGGGEGGLQKIISQSFVLVQQKQQLNENSQISQNGFLYLFLNASFKVPIFCSGRNGRSRGQERRGGVGVRQSDVKDHIVIQSGKSSQPLTFCVTEKLLCGIPTTSIRAYSSVWSNDTVGNQLLLKALHLPCLVPHYILHLYTH